MITTREDVRKEIVGVVVELNGMDGETIKDEAKLMADLELDDLIDIALLITKIEEKLEIQIPDDDFAGKTEYDLTFGMLLEIVFEKIKI